MSNKKRIESQLERLGKLINRKVGHSKHQINYDYIAEYGGYQFTMHDVYSREIPIVNRRMSATDFSSHLDFLISFIETFNLKRP